MDDRRDPSSPGRRDEDERWLKVQEQIMNLVTAERTDQQELSTMKVEVHKLLDHVEDLDDYLRGVAGEESLDNRVVLLERESTTNSVLLRQIKKQIDELKNSVSDIKIQSAITRGTDDWFMNWIKLWGPIIVATLGLLFSFSKIACQRTQSLEDTEYRPDERLREQIEMDKKKRGKEVQKRLSALEKIQAQNH